MLLRLHEPLTAATRNQFVVMRHVTKRLPKTKPLHSDRSMRARWVPTSTGSTMMSGSHGGSAGSSYATNNSGSGSHYYDYGDGGSGSGSGSGASIGGGVATGDFDRGSSSSRDQQQGEYR